MSDLTDDMAVFVAKREETSLALNAALAEFPAARAAVKEAAAVALAAGRKFNAIAARIQRATKPDDVTAPAIIEILNDAKKVRDNADAAHTLAKAQLANAEWAVACMRDSLTQLDRLLNPGPALRTILPAAKRVPPGPQTIETIVFPAGHPGEAA